MLGLWGEVPELVTVDQLSMKHPAVIDAAEALGRII